ncbi:MAG: HlyD family efflux transporter periplasmic adaptor subunit [Bacteroidota bacterium]
MLNISDNPVTGIAERANLRSAGILTPKPRNLRRRYILLSVGAALGAMLFLPWTQTVSGTGRITTLKPGQRPQELHSSIGGRIEQWFVKEGDFVQAGDTLLYLSEIKEDYFDPSLLPRTRTQIDAKSFAVESYKEKAGALDQRINALEEGKKLKLRQAANKIEQARLKIKSDSIEAQAAKVNYDITVQQYDRINTLFQQGLKSKTDRESRELKRQEAQAKLISARNKLLTSRNELLNIQVELVSVGNDYVEKIAKARSEKFQTLSGRFDAEAEVSKMEGAFAKYSVRSGLYYVRAPQSGFITKTLKTGIGETIYQGEEILTIMPARYDLAVELFISPQDLPLVSVGTHVRLIFDGWPALVFSGWQGVSSGTFGGRVVAMDKFTGKGGKFRILVSPDADDVPWPEALRVGSGASGMALLNDVPVWYEIWRQLNGFPPEYYEENSPEPSKSEKPKVKIQ